MSEENEIDRVFPAKNRIVLLYDNNDEAQANTLAEYLEKKESACSVMSYGSTIGKEHSVEEMADIVEDIGSDISIDQTMMDFIYYEYRDGNPDKNLTLTEFVSFLQNEIMQNERFTGIIDTESKSQIDSFALFTDTDELSKQRSSAELGQMIQTIVSSVMEEKEYSFSEMAAFQKNLMKNRQSFFTHIIAVSMMQTVHGQ